jgi:tripartite-type tricarboxylate transporter receptor subunit TctC
VGALVADTLARPGQLNYGSWSVGNPVHLGVDLLAAAPAPACSMWCSRKPRSSIPRCPPAICASRWAAQPLPARCSARASCAFWRLRRQRSPDFPDVPTVGESGGPGLEVSGWNALVAPVGLPPAVAE